LSGFKRLCVLEASFVGTALFWFARGELVMALGQVVFALLFLAGFLWDSRQSRALRYTYDALIAICVVGIVFFMGRILGRHLGWGH
jgi:hypothetical protein